MVEGTKPKDYYTDDKGIVHPIFDAGVIAGLTPGSVLFAGAGGIISQDNANFFWDNASKTLKIGSFGELVSEQNPDGANAIRLKGTASDVDVVLGHTSGYFSVWNAADNNDVFSVSDRGNIVIAGDLTVDTDTLFVDAGNNKVGIGTAANAVGKLEIIDAQHEGLAVLSKDATKWAAIAIGRTATDFFIGVANDVNAFFFGTVAGDVIIKNVDDTKSLHFGTGPTGPPELRIENNKVRVISGGLSAAAPVGSADDFIIETSINKNFGMSILGHDTKQNNIVFGSPSRPFGAAIRWKYSDNILSFFTANANAEIVFGAHTGGEDVRIAADGSVGIGTAGSPATSALLDLTSTTGALLVSRMTTVQRDALTAVNGMIIYNSTTNAFNFYENGFWVTGSGLA